MDAEAFATFVSVLSSGDPNSFEMIPRDRRAEVYLNDPQATYAFDLAGLDSAATSLDPPPAFSSALMASAFAEPLMSGTRKKPTLATVFRGETPGDLIGPYLSQFLWLDIPSGIKTVEQRYTVPTRGISTTAAATSGSASYSRKGTSRVSASQYTSPISVRGEWRGGISPPRSRKT